MRRALDPESNELHGIEWFLLNHKEMGLCEVCGQAITLRAARSVEVSTHFWHGPDASCPSIKKHRPNYPGLGARHKASPEEGVLLRQQVKDNLYPLYATCSALAGGLKFADFKEMLRQASASGMWDYKGLTLSYVPYLLLTFQPVFSAKDSKLRDKSMFAILEPKIQKLDDLWTQKERIKQKMWFVSVDGEIVKEVDFKNHLDPEPDWFKSAKGRAAELL